MTAIISPTLPETRPTRGTRWRLLAMGGVVLFFLATPLWGRYLAFFRVHTVEVRGARFARQEEILARLGVDSTHSIWGSLDALQRRVERHPQVRSASVHRRLPSRLIVDIVEQEPVAFVPQRDGMRAYEENGRPLPIDPARVHTDLPVVDRPDTSILRLLADLRADYREVYNAISEVRLVDDNEIRIRLLELPVRALRGIGAERFGELSSVQRDLATRGITPVELDLRFKDQVIARLP